MAKNVTIKLDDALLKQCRKLAVEEEKSLSQWVADMIIENLSRKTRFERARKKALIGLKKGFSLGGSPLSREDLHER